MSTAHALRRFTRHDFNRAAWLKARRSGRASPAPVAAAPPAPAPSEPSEQLATAAPPSPQRRWKLKLDLINAPSMMELRAASWGQRHA